MATRDWAAEFAAAEQAGVDKEQAEVDKMIADADATFNDVVEEALEKVTIGAKDRARSERLATSGAAFLQPQVVEVPAPPASPSQEEIDAAAAELRAQEAAAEAAREQAAAEARAAAERSVVVPPAPAETAEDRDIVPAMQAEPKAEFNKNPRRWTDAQLIAGGLLAIIGFLFGAWLFSNFGGWTSFNWFFMVLCWLAYVAIFTVTGFYIGSYAVWKFHDHRKEVVAA